MSLEFAAIRAAHDRIRPHIHRTPVLTSARLDAACGGALFFKCENFQKVGAFKARGATNAVLALDDATAKHGVVAHSSGNHGAALARAARLRGIDAHIVMPSDSSKVKVRAVEGYGGRVTFCEPTPAARQAICAQVMAATGGTLIHPFENEEVMAGQGTAMIELLEDIGDLDLIVTSVGGGGLLAGTAVAAKHLRPGMKVMGTEPENVSDAAQSLRAGHLVTPPKAHTIADGLRGNLGQPNFAVFQRYVDGIVTVSEESIVTAMRAIWETMKIIVEPSAAVPYAAILEKKLEVNGRRVGIIISGGNLDLDALPWVKS
ncbi:MAG: L-threonine dehydratase catabolic TdcB [Verrucomicrobiota bacterium]|jgi:threonine dehydratase